MLVASLLAGREVDAAVRTHIGAVRARNEDSVDLGRIPLGDVGEGVLVAVADGMGGVSGGATASALTVQVVAESLPLLESCFRSLDVEWQRRASTWLRSTALLANDGVRQLANDEPSLSGMGSTLLLGLVAGGWLGVAWVGDSRAYLYRDQTLVQLTRDHSWDVDRELEGHGGDPDVESSPYRGMLTSVIGRSERTEIGVRWERLESGDLLVFASDGLTAYYDGEQLANALASAETTSGEAEGIAELLIAWANAAGGSDNISVGIVRVCGTSNRFPSPSLVTQSQVPHRAWRAFTVAAPYMRAENRHRSLWRIGALGVAVAVTLSAGIGAGGMYLSDRDSLPIGSVVRIEAASAQNGDAADASLGASDDSSAWAVRASEPEDVPLPRLNAPPVAKGIAGEANEQGASTKPESMAPQPTRARQALVASGETVQAERMDSAKLTIGSAEPRPGTRTALDSPPASLAALSVDSPSHLPKATSAFGDAVGKFGSHLWKGVVAFGCVFKKCRSAPAPTPVENRGKRLDSSAVDTMSDAEKGHRAPPS